MISKTKSIKTISLLLAIMMIMTLVLTACNEVPTIYIKAKSTISKGETVSVTAYANNGEECKLSVTDATLLTLSYDEDSEGYVLTVANEPTVDTEVTIVATLASNSSVSATKKITVKAAPKTISIVVDKESLASKSEYATITVDASDESGYTLTSSNSEIIRIFNNTASIWATPSVDTEVTITATLNSDPSVTASKTILVKAKSVVDTVTILSDVSEISEATESNVATLSVTVPQGENYVLTVTKGESYITLDSKNGTITWNANDLVSDTYVTIQATLESDNTIYDDINIVVRAKKVEGKVVGANGIELTTEKINAVGNASITASGVLADYYNDLEDSTQTINQYDMTVKMSEGAWSGSWNIKGKSIVSTDNYCMGDATGKQNALGVEYHNFNKLYIDKNNQVAAKAQKDYNSQPIYWEEQHLWNHMSTFRTDKFTNAEALSTFDLTAYGYSSNEGLAVFKYTSDNTSEEDLYFRTYISYFLTPMCSDTVESIYLVVDKDGIVGLIAQTEILYYYGTSETDDEGYTADESEDPIASSYTIFYVRFSNVGETLVEDPAVYTIGNDIYNQGIYGAFESALSAIKGSNNYTFLAEDVTTYAPTLDEDDYTIDSTEASSTSGSSSSSSSSSSTGASALRYQLSSTGTVGTVGYITADAIVLGTTGKYEYALDDKLYHTTFSGYRQFEGYYEEFAYNYTTNSLYGTKRVSGNIVDLIPQFNFSTAIFQISGMLPMAGTTNDYKITFSLRDGNITRDVALESSMYSYATDATSSISQQLTVEIIVSGLDMSTWTYTSARLARIVYPYSISGIYEGYVTTTYDNIGTTTLDEEGSKFEGLFDGYVARQIMSDWSMYTLKDFYYLHTGDHTNNYGCYYQDAEGNSHWTCSEEGYGGHIATADVVLKWIFGEENYADIPQASLFLDIFGDNLSGPFFDYTEKNGGYRDSMTVTTVSNEYDENMKITNYEEICEQLKTALEALGFEYSEANSNNTAESTGSNTRYMTFVKNNVEIVIENNCTRYFWINFYTTGSWTLSD